LGLPPSSASTSRSTSRAKRSRYGQTSNLHSAHGRTRQHASTLACTRHAHACMHACMMDAECSVQRLQLERIWTTLCVWLRTTCRLASLIASCAPWQQRSAHHAVCGWATASNATSHGTPNGIARTPGWNDARCIIHPTAHPVFDAQPTPWRTLCSLLNPCHGAPCVHRSTHAMAHPVSFVCPWPIPWPIPWRVPYRNPRRLAHPHGTPRGTPQGTPPGGPCGTRYRTHLNSLCGAARGTQTLGHVAVRPGAHTLARSVVQPAIHTP